MYKGKDKFIEWLRAESSKKGVSELAREISRKSDIQVTDAAISKWINKGSFPNPNSQRAIAVYKGWQVDEVLRWLETGLAPDEQEEPQSLGEFDIEGLKTAPLPLVFEALLVCVDRLKFTEPQLLSTVNKVKLNTQKLINTEGGVTMTYPTLAALLSDVLRNIPNWPEQLIYTLALPSDNQVEQHWRRVIEGKEEPIDDFEWRNLARSVAQLTDHPWTVTDLFLKRTPCCKNNKGQSQGTVQN